MRKIILSIALVFLLLTACSTNEPVRMVETATQAPTATATAVPVQETPTAVPPTTAPTSTETPLPSPTSTPTNVPTPTETPLPLGSQAIGLENAAQITELAALGKGAILNTHTAAGGKVLLVLTPLGLYHLDAKTLAEIHFQAGAVEFFPLPDEARLLVRYPEGLLKVVQAADGQELFGMGYQVKIPWNYENWIDRLPRERREAMRDLLRKDLLRITSVATSPDLTRLAVATGDHHIRLWNLEDGTLVQDLEHDLVTDIEQMVFSPDLQRLVVVERSRDMAMWQIAQGKLLWHRKEVGHLNGQPFSPDGTLLAAEISSYISADAWVVLLSAEYGDELGKITGARVSSDPFSADSKHLATYWYQRVRIFLTTNLAYIQKIETGLDIGGVSYSSDGAYLLINGGEQAWNSQDFTPADAAPFKPTPAPVYADPTTALRAEGFYTGLQGVLPLAAGGLRAWGNLAQKEYYWFDLPEGEMRMVELPVEIAWGQAAPVFAADGSAIFYCDPARLYALSLVESEPRDLGRCSTRGVLAYSPATGILARGLGTTLDLIDVASGEIVHNLLGHYKQISGLAFSQDGSLLASGSADVGSRGYGEVAMWTTEPAHNLVLNDLQPWGVYELAYSPDDRWLAYYNNGNLRLWSVAERRLVAYFDSTAVKFTFSPDSLLLAAGDPDGKVHLYEVPSGKELVVVEAALGKITGLAFSLDGKTLIVTAEDGLIRLLGIQ